MDWNKVPSGTKFIVNDGWAINAPMTFLGVTDQDKGLLRFRSGDPILIHNMPSSETLLSICGFGKNWTAYELVE